jgi:L-cysteine:1D-myo-inositol 2-amino-2-deoxy-alpha-D-glucopyranoside ligase
MKSWPTTAFPAIPKATKPLKVFSTSAQSVVEIPPKTKYQMYVCGITPYDATHLGHAATYLTFDLVNRYWRAMGAEVNYIQNITDIDDPLLERANRDGVDWKELAHSQIDLFRSDMQLLRVLPPTHYEGAVDAIPDVVEAISNLERSGSVYDVDSDKYFEVHVDKDFGGESHLPESEMLEIFAERGGDPSRAGKRDALDALLWLAHREGEPAWPSKYGAGRPGWHIECAAIALKFAEPGDDFVIDIQGGGKDLIFPHHEMSASQVKLLTGKTFARAYVHAALIGLDGEKMSKSKGNLVFVSKLIEDGVSPMAIRWALLKRPYCQEYMWLRNETKSAQSEIDMLKLKLSSAEIPPTENLIQEIYDFLADDLKSADAIEAINAWVNSTGTGGNAKLLIDVIDGLLGIALTA